MTKEELKKEAEEWLGNNLHSASEEDFIKAMVDIAEPRENEIKSLGERCLQLQKDKGNLTDKVRELEEKLANADYQLEGRDLEIKELETQIEKMKCCGNCKKLKGRFNSNTNINILYCSDSDMKQIEVGFQMCCCKWEIKEK